MFKSVQEALNTYPSQWESTPLFQAKKAELDAIIRGVEDNLRAESLYFPRSTTKRNLRREVRNAVLRLQGALSAYAAAYQLNELANRFVNFRSSFTLSGQQLVFLQQCEAVLETARPLRNELVNAGISEAEFAATEALIEEFRSYNPLPRYMKNKLNVVKQNSGQLINEGMNLLRNVLDPLMPVYEVQSPDFFNAYQYARTIIDVRVRFAQNGEQSPDTGTE